MNPNKIPVDVQNQLKNILDEFSADLQVLHSQGILTSVDIRKIENQAQVSRDAIFQTLADSDFDEQARHKLLNALTRDFEVSTQRTLDSVVERKGEKALVAYKLNKADKNIKKKMKSSRLPLQTEQQIFTAMVVTKAYILRTLPSDKPGLFGKKIDAERIVNDYFLTFQDFLNDKNFNQLVNLIG